MYLPRIAIASTSGSRGFSVQIFPRSRMRSTPDLLKFIGMVSSEAGGNEGHDGSCQPVTLSPLRCLTALVQNITRFLELLPMFARLVD